LPGLIYYICSTKNNF